MIKHRGILYLIALTAIVLDWGSTVIVTLQRGEFNELNPIALTMGFDGAALYAVGIIAVMALVLFKWGIQFEASRDRKVILTDWLAIALIIQGLTACFNNFGIIPVAQSLSAFYVSSGVSFCFAGVAAFSMNRDLLRGKLPVR